MKIAHFSDIHYTLPPWRGGIRWGEGKRAVGSVSFWLSRCRRFGDIGARITTLLEDVEAQGVDHAVCTGDVSGVADPTELQACAELFGARLHDATKWTVLPGNHDCYTPKAQRDNRFGQLFYAPVLPYAKVLSPTVALLAIETTRVNFWVDSSGRLSADTLAWLARQLDEHEGQGRTCIIAQHYGLLRRDGSRDHRHHAIRNDDALLALLAARPNHPRLLVHGHLHGAFVYPHANNLLLCAGSATDLGTTCGYYVIDLKPDGLCSIERREYDGARYVTRTTARWSAAPSTPTRWVATPA